MSASKTLNTIGRTKGHIAAVLGVAAIGVMSFAAPVSAQASAEPTGDQIARLELACNRIPNLTTRSENLLERINGDVETRGSLAWLDVKIAQASERGLDDLAVVLENRRVVRESVIPVLDTRLERLAELSDRCSEAGFGQ